MRNFVLIFVACLLFSSCQRKEQHTIPEHISIEIEPLSIPKDTAAFRLRQEKIHEELDYYLKRHTIDEEGFDMIVNYADKGNRLLTEYLTKHKADILGMLTLKNVNRQGFGMKRDSSQRVSLGHWHRDTLTTGMRIDSIGIYAGQFNSSGLASGHGCLSEYDGTFYEGHWVDDKKEGFGYKVSTTNLQSGTWRNDRFFGERMQHTSDRIYGIDLSRYQHERGRRRYSINWNNLRIKNLGRRIKGNISGDVDYPVRFVYIKSTQGTTIRNRYLPGDYRAARRKKIPVGTYHFFSTVRKGREQAAYYLKHTSFNHGDLPPVLDIEPTDRQIRKMGGTAVLLREIRAWIDHVERRLHVKPMLYVNQLFLKKHLVEAPDLLEKYTIWIARYGEYKPGVHLAIWQVSADAKVQGIHTDVDVNVFNGFEPQWEEFLREETISKP